MDTDDKKRGRLNLIAHLLSQVPYQAAEAREVTLPRRTTRPKYPPMDLTPHMFPVRY